MFSVKHSVVNIPCIAKTAIRSSQTFAISFIDNVGKDDMRCFCLTQQSRKAIINFC